MGEKNIKNTQVKKKKKSDTQSVSSSSVKPMVTQPELIKKKKKPL